MNASPQDSNRSVRTFIAGLSKSRFFTISALLHLLAIFIFGGTAFFNAYVEPDPSFQGGEKFVSDDQPLYPQQTSALEPTNIPNLIPMSTSPVMANDVITRTHDELSRFDQPRVPPLFVPGEAAYFHRPVEINTTQVITDPSKMSLHTAQQIRTFSEDWGKGNAIGNNSGPRSREFEFTAYVAKYGGGDWNSTVRLQDNRITFGSLPNLLYMMQSWSRDKIKATPDPVPLDLSSDQIFAVKPPFIFFTGHRDFRLTDKEVENLRKYIRMGGAIWGDSSLPGQRSRFDIAFRREMKRVVGDIDKEFELLPAEHPIFDARQTYFPEIREVPHGINHYKEPVYALKYYGEIAVLYTANDYGDMWQIGLTKDGKFDLRRNSNDQPVAMNMEIFSRRDTYFRGVTEEAVANSYKFGTNVVLHLLTRWENRLRNIPRL